MALTYTTVVTDPSTSMPLTTLQIASGTTTSGSLMLCMVVVTASGGVTEAQHFTATAGSNISDLVFLGAKRLGSSTTRCAEWYQLTGAGGTSNPNLTWSGLGFVGSSASLGVAMWEVTGVSGLTIRQSAAQKATNATASVSLSSAVLTGNECFFMGTWTDFSDNATPASGWTEKTDTALANERGYGMYHPTPTGSQNGQVSAIASMDNASMIVEINNPSGQRDGGFGSIPIF